MSLRGNGLSQRVARRILGITLASLAVASAALATSSWLDETNRLENLVAQIERAFAPPLTESLWLVDLPLAESQLRAMTRIEGIAYVSVKLFTGQQFHFTAAGDDAHSAFLMRRTTLQHEGRPVATLELAADRRVLVDAVLSHLLQMLSIQGLLLALGGYVLFRTVNREATCPLETAAARLAVWRPGDPAVSLTLPGGDASNEITTLSAAFGRMQETLAGHLAQQQALQHELAQHRDRLAELATSRGRTLSHLEGLEHRALDMSTGLISLPREMIAPQIRHSLADICRYAGLDFAGLLVSAEAAAVHLEKFWEAVASAGLDTLPAPLRDELAHWARLRQAARSVEIMDGLDTVHATADGARAAFAQLGYRALIAIPLQVRDSAHGILILARASVAPPWPEPEIAFFQLVGQIVASALAQQQALQQLEATRQDLEAANAELDRMSRTDPLTGLANRREFDEARIRELNRARRSTHPLTLLLLDVDHFKAYNDTLGHAEGDVCLAALAALLRDFARRPGDLVARIGGEEFVLLLPDTDAAGAERLYAEMRQTLRQRALPHPASPVGALITLSAGIAQYDAAGNQTYKDFFATCDAALYAAKHTGRDRCIVAGQRAAATR